MDDKVQEILTERNKIKPTDIFCGVSYVDAKCDRWIANSILEDRMKFDPDEIAGVKPSERLVKTEQTDLPKDPTEIPDQGETSEPSEEEETPTE